MAKTKRASKIRQATEFAVATLARPIVRQDSHGGVFSWTLEDIVAARNAQARGDFSLPARLAVSMRTDDALAVAYENRLAPQRCLAVELQPANEKPKALSVAEEGEALFGDEGLGITPETCADIHGCLVNHGVAFATVKAVVREDGSRTDLFASYWPIEHVRWDEHERTFKTRVGHESTAAEGVGEMPITHGDGRWIVFSKHEHQAWTQEAALLPAALVWARHAFAVRDHAKGSLSHGNAKVVGEMPENVALQDAEGALTEEAQAFLELLRAIASADTPVGIRPSGAKTEYITNNSTAWQVWTELSAGAEKAAARIYLGTDGTLGTDGGAPGIDITQLFGVATTRVQGDLWAIERGFKSGLIDVWCALNFGDSTLAPSRVYKIPDADADALRASLAERRTAFYADIAAAKANGFEITQAYVDAIAERYQLDVGTIPQLPAVTEAKAPTIVLAPDDLANVVTVDEARASAGVGPWPMADGTGALTVGQFVAKVAAAAQAMAAAPAPVSDPPVPA